MLTNTFRFLFENFPLTFFMAGLCCALIKMYRHRINITKAYIAEAFISNYLLWSIAICFIYNGVIKMALPAIAAITIPPINNTIQPEISIASIGTGITCLLVFKKHFAARLAVLILSSIFLWGCAAANFWQTHTAQSNAGFMFWVEVLQPFINIAALIISKKYAPDEKPLQLFTYQQKTFIAIPVKK